MAISAADIHNQSFSVDRKGYNVDEVDVFLERVADEIDALNAQVRELEQEAANDQFAGFDRPAGPTDEEFEAALAEKDAIIASLQAEIEARRADDNAIAQALIVAQRSGDQIIENANAQAEATIQDAEDEAQSILDRAEAERQKVLDAIKKLEDDREAARLQYKDLLTDFVNDATRKLSEITEAAPAPKVTPKPKSAHAAPSPSDKSTKGYTPVQAPVKRDTVSYYSTPQPVGAVVAPATPKPSAIEKDFSGFGDADSAFDFEVD